MLNFTPEAQPRSIGYGAIKSKKSLLLQQKKEKIIKAIALTIFSSKTELLVIKI